MKLNFGITKEERKAFVSKIGEILEVQPVYQGAPGFSYQIGFVTVEKDGTVEIGSGLESEKRESLLERLEAAGYHHALPADEETGMSISFPTDGLDETAMANLQALVSAKQSLIQKSLGMNQPPRVVCTENSVDFPWFPEPRGPEEIQAYTDLAEGLIKEAKSLKRVTAKAHEYENEKYAFRTFLLRLGFVGDRYKSTRKILLRNLSGSSAFRDGRAAPCPSACSDQS